MKSCIIVNYWADDIEKTDVVIKCLNQLKKTNIDLIYTSIKIRQDLIQIKFD